MFAPTDDAFAKIPSKDLNAVLKDKATLTKILTHHVVAGQLSPDQIAGTHDTLAKDQVTVKGDEQRHDRRTAPRSSAATSRRPTPRCTSSTPS